MKNKLNLPDSIDVKVKNMMNDGFYFGSNDKLFYPPVVHYTGADKDEVYIKICKAIDNLVHSGVGVESIHIGTIGYNDLDSAIVKDGNGYKAVLAIAGMGAENDQTLSN